MILLLTAAIWAADEKPAPAAAAAPTYDDVISAARDAEAKGLVGKATELLQDAVRINAKRPEAWFYRAKIFIVQEKHKEAIAMLDEVIKLVPAQPDPYQLRGEEHFRIGEVEKACDDFDKFIVLKPKVAADHWQRGIALYYAGRFDDARKQFELHQTVNTADVENAAWHFLCVARLEGFEKARENFIPITGDRRVPMAQIHKLFAGQGTEDDIFKATLVGKPNPEQLKAALFYAHLYLGLFYEAKGDEKKAFENIKAAATQHASKHYMGDVARVHFQRLLRKPKPAN